MTHDDLATAANWKSGSTLRALLSGGLTGTSRRSAASLSRVLGVAPSELFSVAVPWSGAPSAPGPSSSAAVRSFAPGEMVTLTDPGLFQERMQAEMVTYRELAEVIGWNSRQRVRSLLRGDTTVGADAAERVAARLRVPDARTIFSVSTSAKVGTSSLAGSRKVNLISSQRLRETMADKGVSRSELAEVAQWKSASSLGFLLSGRDTSLSGASAERIADHLGVDPLTLFTVPGGTDRGSPSVPRSRSSSPPPRWASPAASSAVGPSSPVLSPPVPSSPSGGATFTGWLPTRPRTRYQSAPGQPTGRQTSGADSYRRPTWWPDPPTTSVVSVPVFRAFYPNIARHIEDAIASGRPRVLTLDRDVTRRASRRRAATGSYAVRRDDGFDRDEYPPAASWEGGGSSSVRYIPSSENQGAGASFGAFMSSYPDGTRFQFEIIDDDSDGGSESDGIWE